VGLLIAMELFRVLDDGYLTNNNEGQLKGKPLFPTSLVLAQLSFSLRSASILENAI